MTSNLHYFKYHCNSLDIIQIFVNIPSKNKNKKTKPKKTPSSLYIYILYIKVILKNKNIE